MYDKSDCAPPLCPDWHLDDPHPKRRKLREPVILAEIERLQQELHQVAVEALARDHDPEEAEPRMERYDAIRNTIEGLEQMLEPPTDEEMIQFLTRFIDGFPLEIQAAVIGDLAPQFWPNYYEPVETRRPMQTLQTRLTASEYDSVELRAKAKDMDISGYARHVLYNLDLIDYGCGANPLAEMPVQPTPYKRTGAKRDRPVSLRLSWIDARNIQMTAKSYEVTVSDLLRFALTLHEGQ